MANDKKDPEYVKSLSEKQKANPKDFAAQKAQYDSAVKQDADKSQPGTMEMLGNLYKNVVGKKAGGTVHNVDYVKGTAGGTHHSEHYKEHAAGHTAHHEHIKNFGKR
jgi:hypothetical protein